MSLADPADRRIAGHGPDVGFAERGQRNSRAAPSCGARCLDARVASSNDNHVEHESRNYPMRARRSKKLVFHVKLFAEAEATEQSIEQFLDTGAA